MSVPIATQPVDTAQDVVDPRFVNRARRRRTVVYLVRAAVFVVIFGGWQLFTQLGIVDQFFFGQPTKIADYAGAGTGAVRAQLAAAGRRLEVTPVEDAERNPLPVNQPTRCGLAHPGWSPPHRPLPRPRLRAVHSAFRSACPGRNNPSGPRPPPSPSSPTVRCRPR